MEIDMRANSTSTNEVMSDFLTHVRAGKVGQRVRWTAAG
jgi:hypothetical protein